MDIEKLNGTFAPPIVSVKGSVFVVMVELPKRRHLGLIIEIHSCGKTCLGHFNGTIWKYA